MKTALAIVLSLLIANPLNANCAQFFQGHYGGGYAVKQQFNYGYAQKFQQVYYDIGAQSKGVAQLEYAKRHDPALIEQAIKAAKWDGYLEGRAASAVPDGALSQRAGAIAQHCGRCHDADVSDSAGGGFSLTQETIADANWFRESMRRMSLPKEDPDHMPKNAVLKPDQLGAVMEEFLSYPISKPSPEQTP